jgi:RHS repeat-associated protein
MGNRTVYLDGHTSRDPAERGQFKKFIDAGGAVTEVTARSGTKITEVQRKDASGVTRETWNYSYDASGRISLVELKQGATLVRRVAYSYYTSSDTGGKSGDLRTASVGDAMTVKTVSSITRGGTGNLTATATVTSHGYSTGDTVSISGATQAAYNGTFAVKVVDGNTFTYKIASDPGASASGTIRSDKPFDVSYYRYYTSGDNDGEIKMVFDPPSFARLASSGLAVSQITRGGAGNLTATAAATAHGLAVGDAVVISGANQSAYNGGFTVASVVDANTFTYTVASDPGASATGTITVRRPFDRFSDTQALAYAANYFEYDSSDRVTKEIAQGAGCTTCTGGFGTFNFLYAENTASPSGTQYNRWQKKVTEILPDDNNTNLADNDRWITYVNEVGGVMLRVFQEAEEGTSYKGAITRTYYEYDDNGRLLMTAYPSAVTGHDESDDELVVRTTGTPGTDPSTGAYTYIANTDGLLEINKYLTSGDAIGYLGSQWVRRGDDTSVVKLRDVTYTSRTANGATVRPIATDTVYPTAGGAGQQTSYAYTWFDGSTQARSLTITHPVVSSSNNGSNSAVTEQALFDRYGRQIWSIDGDGYVNYSEYDPVSGGVTKTIVDTPYASHVTQDQPLGYWRFGELVGATHAPDSSGNDVAGTYTGSVTLEQSSGLLSDTEKSAQFSGGYVNLGTAPSLDLAGSTVTWEGWVNTTSTSTALLFGAYDNSGAFTGWGVGYSVATAGKYAFWSSGTGSWIQSNSTVNDGNWHHVAVVVNAGAGTFYRDGVADGTFSVASWGASLASKRIGSTSTGTLPFSGKMDDVAAYASALSSTRIADHYSAGRGAQATRVGLGLTSRRNVDALGRIVKSTDPNGNETHTKYNDAAHEVRTYPGWVAVGGGLNDTTGPVQVYREDRAASYIETLTFDLTPAAAPTGSESISTSNLQTLSRDYTNAAGQLVSSDRYFSFSGLSYSTAVDVGTLNTNRYRTEYLYDYQGRPSRVKNAVGTIRRTVRDGFGREVGEWIGTDDTGASHQDPTGGGASGNNMMRWQESAYDGAPEPPHLSDSAGGSFGQTTYYVAVTYTNSSGSNESLPSHELKRTVAANRLLIVDTPKASRAWTHYNVYVSTAAGQWTRQNTSPRAIGSQTWLLPTTGLIVGATPTVRSGGDGNLTHQSLDMGDGSTIRTTDFYHDWRDRLVVIKQGVELSESSTLNRPITYMDLDNLGRVTYTYLYDGDTVTLSMTNGVPTAPSSGLLRAKSQTQYDEWNRPFRMQQYSVDSSGNVAANTLKTESWFDARGNLTKQLEPGGLITKSTFDAAGRVTTHFITDGLGDSGYSDAADLADNNVLEQFEYGYDNNGNVILATRRRRFHNQNGIGPLGSAGTGVLSRVSYVSTYYDAADRVTAHVDVGTYGGSSYARPSSVPARSSTTVVTSYDYNAAGWVEFTTDPKGFKARTLYDAAGRLTRTTEAYNSGVGGGEPTSANTGVNRRTDYTYTAIDQVKTLTAVLPDPGTVGGSNYAVQTTQYDYAAAGGPSSVYSNDFLTAIHYPNKTTGAASLADADTKYFYVNTLGETAGILDPNQSIEDLRFYDAVGRFTESQIIQLGTGIDGAIRRRRVEYDTAGRPYLFTSYIGQGNGESNQVKRAYNGLGQVVTEWQENNGAVNDTNSPKVQYAYSEMSDNGQVVNHSRLVSVIYPNGRVLEYSYNPTRKAVSSITRGGTGNLTATATSTSHGLSPGDTIVVSGASPSQYNGTSIVASVPNANTFTYTMTSDPGASASGSSMQVKKKLVDDDISRVNAIQETVSGTTTVLEAYDYLGLSTIIQRRRPQPGSDLTYYGTGATGDAGDQYAGLDRFDRIVNQWWKSGSNATDRFTYGYDENSNRTWKEVLGTNAPTNIDEVYTYDNLNRLTDVDRGSVTNGSIGTITWAQSWTIDALGNWDYFDDNGTGNDQDRTHNFRNQITSGTGGTVTYDANGNQTQDETGKDYRFDAWNRGVGVDVNGDGDFADNGDIKYRYDYFDRRISEEIIGGTTTHFYYSAEWQVLEERDGASSSAKRQYVWGQAYVDALILRDRDVLSGGDLGKTGSGLDERVYAQQDANFNVTSVVNTSGSVVERFQYAPYGSGTVFNGAADKDAPVTDWSADANNASDWDWLYLHQGGRFSGSSGNYHFRNRDLDVSLGRWTRPDPIEYVDGAMLYEYVRGQPIGKVDPSGSKCRIAVRCYAPLSGSLGHGSAQLLGNHCGLIVETDVGTTSIDGTGLRNGITSTGPEGEHNADKGNYPNLAGKAGNHPDSTCDCLLGKNGNNTLTNWKKAAAKVPYNPLDTNSNWSMKCFLKKCNVLQYVHWKTNPPPGWDAKASKCKECP